MAMTQIKLDNFDQGGAIAVQIIKKVDVDNDPAIVQIVNEQIVEQDKDNDANRS